MADDGAGAELDQIGRGDKQSGFKYDPIWGLAVKSPLTVNLASVKLRVIFSQCGEEQFKPGEGVRAWIRQRGFVP